MPTKALTHQQQRLGGKREADLRMSSFRRGYDATWRKVRRLHLARYPACTFCPHPATIVDHIKPLNDGGERLDPDNLRSVCRNCHAILTANYAKTGRNEMT